MSTYSGLITVFASCFTAGFVVIGYLAQFRATQKQVMLNQMHREMILTLHARVENLERQVLSETDLERLPHVH